MSQTARIVAVLLASLAFCSSPHTVGDPFQECLEVERALPPAQAVGAYQPWRPETVCSVWEMNNGR